MIVVGGGIGGLTMALSLHQARIAVRVYEAVSDLAPLGVGINLQPTAVRELTELGLDQALARMGIATDELSYFNKLGQLIYTEKRGLAAGYKWPQYSIHRGQLQLLLLQAVRERIGAENFRNGLRFVGFTQNRNRVTARFHDSASGTAVLDEADILIGADGRGHFQQRIIVYPIGGTAKPGQLLTNWVCQMAVPDNAPPREDWNRRVSKDKVYAAFGKWRFPWLDLSALIDRTPDIYEFPLVDRDPVETWTLGRVTLIGDAAHPMQPIGSQAGSQAIVDARVLTAALLVTSDPIEALQRYDAQRRPMMNEVTLRNRRFGPEAAMQLAEERAPSGFDRIEDVISWDELDEIKTSFSAAAGLDVETVNTRPSFVAIRSLV